MGNLAIESLDATVGPGPSAGEWEAILGEFAIVVSTKDEPPERLNAVIRAIPAPCAVVVVSASENPAPEIRIVEAIGNSDPSRKIALVCQHSPRLAACLKEGGMEVLTIRSRTDGPGTVASGKGEAMMIGTLCALGWDRTLVGFIDADNHAPDTVTEYVHLFALGMARRQSNRCMVRLRWKGKRGPGQPRRDWGRASRFSNAALNALLLSLYPNAGTPITTGNAGEFALTMESALNAQWATSYGAETYLLLQCLEAAASVARPPIAREILQIQTLCEHLHTQKSPAHIARIVNESLSPIRQSPLADAALRDRLTKILKDAADPGNDPVIRYPAIATLGTSRAREAIREYLLTASPATT